MSNPANDSSKIELKDLEPQKDLKGGNHENDQPYTDKWEFRRARVPLPAPSFEVRVEDKGHVLALK